LIKGLGDESAISNQQSKVAIKFFSRWLIADNYFK